MFGRSKTQAVKESAASGTDLAVSLAQDKKFRKQLLSAVGHGATARERAASRDRPRRRGDQARRRQGAPQ